MIDIVSLKSCACIPVALNRKPITELQSVTCHMRSHMIYLYGKGEHVSS